jgi:hypothetical protein
MKAWLLNKNTFISILIYHLQGFCGKPEQSLRLPL